MQPLRFNFDRISHDEIPFTERGYYAAFLQALGIREIKNDNSYSLVSQDESGWSVCLEEVAAAMQNMQSQGASTSKEALSVLQFVIEKMDQDRTIPPYVVTYMCRDAVTRVILQRFKEVIGESYTSLTELSFKISDNIEEANEIINSVRLCDPAIGSGHFLVTLMNEIIAVKSQLGVLADKDGNPLFRYRVQADKEDGLLVYDRKSFDTFKFKPADAESRRIQDTLLREKQIILANCLYGVGTEHFSVSMSKLRLWVELLKHICWEDNPIPSRPFFEGNIRCADPLVSRIPVSEDLRHIFKQIKISVSEYKKYVSDYKNATTKADKNIYAQFIDQVKKKLLVEITLDDRSNKELLKWQKELAVLTSPKLFELDDSDDKSMKIKQIEAQLMVDKYKQRIDDIQHNPMYERAMEWRYEFPELLDESGDFTGFDLLICNPADVQINTSIRAGDAPTLYYELGYLLLKPAYFISHITAESWMKSLLADQMQLNLNQDINPLLTVEFENPQASDNLLEEKGIMVLQKARNRQRMMTCRIKEGFDAQTDSLDDYIRQNSELFVVESDIKVVSPSFAMLPDVEKRIKAKIEKYGTPLISWDIQMNTGIRTGCDDAFVIDGKTKDDFILADYKNTDIIKPLLLGENLSRYKHEYSNQWLICIPWHFPLLYDKNICSASEKAEERFRQQYPIIFRHLVKFRERLLTRNPKEVGVIFEWYAVQHFGTSNEWEDYTKPKIVWKRESPAPGFYLDYSGCAIMDTTCFITGQRLKYLLGFLNSKQGRFMLHDSQHLPNGDIHIDTLTLETMRIPVPGVKTESEMISLVNKRTSDAYQNEYNDIDEKINQLVYDMYELDAEERGYIEGK